MSQLSILSIGIIGKQGNQLYIESFHPQSQSNLKWHYAAHTSLDFFEERDQPSNRTTESYLGLLYAMEDYAVYGYQTNTKIKFIIVLALADAIIRDVDVKIIFRAIHNSYITYLSNPFNQSSSQSETSTLAAPIRSKKFDQAMRTIASGTSTTTPATSTTTA